MLVNSGSSESGGDLLRILTCKALVIHGLWCHSLSLRLGEVQEQTMIGGQQAHALLELACMVCREIVGIFYLN